MYNPHNQCCIWLHYLHCVSSITNEIRHEHSVPLNSVCDKLQAVHHISTPLLKNKQLTDHQSALLESGSSIQIWYSILDAVSIYPSSLSTTSVNSCTRLANKLLVYVTTYNLGGSRKFQVHALWCINVNKGNVNRSKSIKPVALNRAKTTSIFPVKQGPSKNPSVPESPTLSFDIKRQWLILYHRIHNPKWPWPSHQFKTCPATPWDLQ